VYGGFQSSNVALKREPDNSLSGRITRAHLLGLHAVSEDLRGVREAAIVVRRTAISGFQRSSPSVSGVVLRAHSGDIPLFWGFSNVDDEQKREFKAALDSYILGADRNPFSQTFVISNLFGWFGLPFFLIGVVGVLSWPMIFVSCWRKLKNGLLLGAGADPTHKNAHGRSPRDMANTMRGGLESGFAEDANRALQHGGGADAPRTVVLIQAPCRATQLWSS
jgi:hypothetical protein